MPKPRLVAARWFINTFVPNVYPKLNPLAVRLLESPLHPLLSWYVAVVRFQGRRSGRTYDVPFTYHRRDARTLECVTNRRAIWWRNLTGGTGASLLYKGRWLPASADTDVDLTAVLHALARRDRTRRWLMPLPPDDGVVVSVTVDD
jgi:hypothetical protein